MAGAGHGFLPVLTWIPCRHWTWGGNWQAKAGISPDSAKNLDRGYAVY
jgi:hypothetical protein